MAERIEGTVKWFDYDKGYGFITPAGGGTDNFVHITAVEDSNLSNLNEGDKVSYDLEMGKNKKYAAVKIKVEQAAPPRRGR